MKNKKIIKYYELFSLAIAFAAVLSLTAILIFNQSFYVGAIKFIPEKNSFIRTLEIIMGIFTIPVLAKIIIERIK